MLVCHICGDSMSYLWPVVMWLVFCLGPTLSTRHSCGDKKAWLMWAGHTGHSDNWWCLSSDPVVHQRPGVSQLGPVNRRENCFFKILFHKKYFCRPGSLLTIMNLDHHYDIDTLSSLPALVFHWLTLTNTGLPLVSLLVWFSQPGWSFNRSRMI